ncbi:hypothetical protein [Leptolyngbya sp. 7M]|uniref:hypothetical protein n=1 Tax=Leptolyngbya sp. 7M TaxID=2812896 RepID=UPI001B8C84DA|nr:hypothetical protein [Leptolyngbya sp. 7M]QYO68106.1 hypothetical protein JVX88_15835 [Leptolyngbya sp. 7M]
MADLSITSDMEMRTGNIRAIECYREAWQLLKPVYWQVLGVVFVGMLIGGAFSILLGPMMCGIYLVLFDVHEGRSPSFDRLFKGFQFFLPSFLLVLIIMLPVIVMIALIYLPIIAMTLAGERMDESQLWAFLGTTLAIEAIFIVIMTCFHTLLLFAFPLIVDKGMGVIQAIKWSSKGVWRNLSGVASLFGVGMIVSLAGMLLFCIGIYLVMPLILAATVAAYRRVFPANRIDPESGPPPPTAYFTEQFNG